MVSPTWYTIVEMTTMVFSYCSLHHGGTVLTPNLPEENLVKSGILRLDTTTRFYQRKIDLTLNPDSDYPMAESGPPRR
jgi:hypothetical protein